MVEWQGDCAADFDPCACVLSLRRNGKSHRSYDDPMAFYRPEFVIDPHASD